MRDGNYSTGIQAGIFAILTQPLYRSVLAVSRFVGVTESCDCGSCVLRAYNGPELSTLVVTVIIPPSALNMT